MLPPQADGKEGPGEITGCAARLEALDLFRFVSCAKEAPSWLSLFNVGLYGDRTYTRPGGLARGRA